MSTGLLPPGCYDILPPYAGAEARLTSSLIQHFEQFGYALVAPPLLEYTDAMLGGRGASLSPQILRVMDPKTNRVMGLRADMTLQLARIASTRLKDAPRPLRLSYAGNVLRLQASTLEPNRQLRQIGMEQIGAKPGAETEIVFIALTALSRAGLKNITVDLHYPALVQALLTPEEFARAADAIAQKDAAAITRLQLKHGALLLELLRTTGDAETALKKLNALNLPISAKPMLDALSTTIATLKPLMQGHTFTLDVAEQRGFDYYTGISFSFFASGLNVELGRGGRYQIGDEEAVGCSFFAEYLRELLSYSATPNIVHLKLNDTAAIEKSLA